MKLHTEKTNIADKKHSYELRGMALHSVHLSRKGKRTFYTTDL